jgi:DNA-binding NarL/FixJ family response regulator
MTTNPKSTELQTPTILIADDHEIYRRGLTLFLEHEGMKVIGYAATGRQAVMATIKHHPDILVLDIAMPDIDGLVALTILKFLVPEIRIVVLTALPDSLYSTRAHELGADGYFSKGVDNNLLAEYIRDIATNNGSSTNTNTDSISHSPVVSNSSPLSDTQISPNGRVLTEIEILILKLISKGYKNQRISDQLAITNDALKTQLQNIFSKLAVTKNNQSPTYGLLNDF